MANNPFDINISETEVGPPFNKWCASGHVAGEMYRRSGPDSPAEPTRFFLVKANDINSIFCEPCLVVANHMARCKKKGLI